MTGPLIVLSVGCFIETVIYIRKQWAARTGEPFREVKRQQRLVQAVNGSAVLSPRYSAGSQLHWVVGRLQPDYLRLLPWRRCSCGRGLYLPWGFTRQRHMQPSTPAPGMWLQEACSLSSAAQRDIWSPESPSLCPSCWSRWLISWNSWVTWFGPPHICLPPGSLLDECFFM